MNKFLSTSLAGILLLSAPAAFGRSSKPSSPRTEKKHGKTGQNKRTPKHKVSNNIPAK